MTPLQRFKEKFEPVPAKYRNLFEAFLLEEIARGKEEVVEEIKSKIKFFRQRHESFPIGTTGRIQSGTAIDVLTDLLSSLTTLTEKK